jgi:hypothetical protein
MRVKRIMEVEWCAPKRPRLQGRRCAMGLLVFALAFVLIWVLLAALVGEFAEKRGHSSALWYVFSLICSPLIGFFVVGLLPSATDLTPVGYRPCPHCSRTVKVGREICPYCHADLTGKGNIERKAA